MLNSIPWGIRGWKTAGDPLPPLPTALISRLLTWFVLLCCRFSRWTGTGVVLDEAITTAALLLVTSSRTTSWGRSEASASSAFFLGEDPPLPPPSITKRMLFLFLKTVSHKICMFDKVLNLLYTRCKILRIDWEFVKPCGAELNCYLNSVHDILSRIPIPELNQNMNTTFKFDLVVAHASKRIYKV